MSGICSCSVLSSGMQGLGILCDSCSVHTQLLQYFLTWQIRPRTIISALERLGVVSHGSKWGIKLLKHEFTACFWLVSLPGLAPWHQWANRSTFVIVPGSSISVSLQEGLFTPLVVICLEKPAESISHLSVLKDSLQRLGGAVPALPPASEGPNLLFLNSGRVSSFVF